MVIPHPRFIMLGGFLGSGKTTTLLHLALNLQRKGVRVGLITNDQAEGLVDTALASELQLPVREITGGCFCCRSESLVEALNRLSATQQPEVFLAEPVGSCTDLVATVSLPLTQIYRSGFTMAPYAVLVDPFRAMQTLGIEENFKKSKSTFSAEVNYIYRKQLEEAEIIVINKVDVLSPERLKLIHASLEREYPTARILHVASREGEGLPELFDALMTGQSQIKSVMEVDYQRYGRGEALLGWVNGEWEVKTPAKSSVDGNALLVDLIRSVQAKLSAQTMEVAHLKGSLTQANSTSLAAVSAVGGDRPAEARRSLDVPFTKGNLLLNLRAEGDPAALTAAVQAALAELKHVKLRQVNLQSFRPGQPNPTHRVDKV